jgi:hypothetical protein
MRHENPLLTHAIYIGRYNINAISANPNLNPNMITRFTHLAWNWENLSIHRNVTWHFIESNPNLRWDMEAVSKNYNITFKEFYDSFESEMFQNNPNLEWEMYWVVQSHQITWDNINDDSLGIDWSASEKAVPYVGISYNPNITWQNVMERRDINWNYEALSTNPNVTIEIVKSNLNREWDWLELTEHKNITTKMIMENPDLPWEFEDRLTGKQPIDIEYIYFCMEKLGHNLPWNCISSSKYISWDVIVANNLPWDKKSVSSNINITWEIVCNNPNYGWDFGMLSANPNISWDIVVINSNLPWDFGKMSSNPNITAGIVFSNYGLPWDFEAISANEFCHHEFFVSEQYKKILVKRFMNICGEKLIQAACHPSRINYWHEDAVGDYGEF